MLAEVGATIKKLLEKPKVLYDLGRMFSVVGIIASIASIFVIIIISPFLKKVSTDINMKINELTNISKALSTINTYIDEQKSSLKKIAIEKNLLEKEHERIQKILKIDKKDLNAYLEYNRTVREKQKWFGWLIAFFIGILSSSLIAFIGFTLRKRSESIKIPKLKE